MSIAQIMDARREAALQNRLGDALREHVGSAKRRKQRTRTSCEANTSQSSPARDAHGAGASQPSASALASLATRRLALMSQHDLFSANMVRIG